MTRDNQNGISAGDILFAFGVGFVAGTAVGVAVGLLTAPKQGAALRQDLKSGARKLRESAAERCQTASDTATRWAEQARDAAERGRTAVSAGLREVQKHTTAAQDPGEAVLAGVEGLGEHI